MLFAFPEHAELANKLSIEQGNWEWRHFPDGESYVRLHSQVKGKEAFILCSLNQPDTKTLPLLFLASALRQQGARKITLLAPYLAYMRQDKAFLTGEAVTSEIFGPLLSRYIDAMVTIDPHLHRHSSMSDVYSCECHVLSAAPLIAASIHANIRNPLIIGPDAESEQWVKEVAGNSLPVVVLQKIRHGDREVEIALPDISQYNGRIPVLIDDIISTAATMIKAIGLLKAAGFGNAQCFATHGVFCAGAYEALKKAGAASIVTTNTVSHHSNGMDISSVLNNVLGR